VQTPTYRSVTGSPPGIESVAACTQALSARCAEATTCSAHLSSGVPSTACTFIVHASRGSVELIRGTGAPAELYDELQKRLRKPILSVCGEFPPAAPSGPISSVAHCLQPMLHPWLHHQQLCPPPVLRMPCSHAPFTTLPPGGGDTL
jgi:hypothetical protein